MILPSYFWPTLGAVAMTAALFYLVQRLHGLAQRKLEAWRRLKREGVAAKAAEVLSLDRLVGRVSLALSLARWLILGLALVRLVSYELEQFPETKAAGDWIVEIVLMPFKRIWDAFVGYIPDLFQLIAIVVVTKYLLVLVHRIFRQIESGALTIKGFYREWADPTYKLVRFFILALALVAVFPYLPGSKSPAFQMVGVFLGVVFSLGSSSVVSNTVSGTILTYMRALQIGDRVQIGETVGDVIERTFLVTRVQTLQNEIVTIPNSVLLSGTITNFSTMAAQGKLILRATVTIGYDAPWPRVHEALLEAARRTALVLAEPAPFVLQTALNDYNVSYILNVYVREAQRSLQIRSELHQRIQDTFQEARIEILSPMYNTVRQSQPHDTLQLPPPSQNAG